MNFSLLTNFFCGYSACVYSVSENSYIHILYKFPILKYLKFLSLTTQLGIIALTIIFFIIIVLSIFKQKNYFNVISNNTQILFSNILLMILNLVDDNIDSEHKRLFVPLIFTIFILVLVFNIVGLIPYTFAVTGQLIFCLTISYTVHIAAIIIGIKTHGIKFFSKFFPQGLHVALAPLIVVIECISFIFQPISLALRLFANIMAGHILLFTFGAFVFIMGKFSGILALSQLVPLIILIMLCILEFAVAFIQAYVFALLCCIYINGVINLH
jgi:F-type H+-transporting ATPase subunit a